MQCCSRDFTTDGEVIGEWAYPNQMLVQNRATSAADMDTFYRTRGQSTVRLHSTDSTINSGGIFQCEVMNMAEEDISVYVGIYPEGMGEYAEYLI